MINQYCQINDCKNKVTQKLLDKTSAEIQPMEGKIKIKYGDTRYVCDYHATEILKEFPNDFNLMKL